jgi:hypothetical protein
MNAGFTGLANGALLKVLEYQLFRNALDCFELSEDSTDDIKESPAKKLTGEIRYSIFQNVSL